MSIQAVEVPCCHTPLHIERTAGYRLLYTTGQLDCKIIIPPALGVHGILVYAGTQIAAVRTAAYIAIRVALQPERRILTAGGYGTHA